MKYNDRVPVKVLVVYPNVAEQFSLYRERKGLPPVPMAELTYGNDEVMEVVNRLDAHLLSGRKATIHGLLDILAEGWDIVWLITHSAPEGWFLTDGLVSVSETATLIRSSGTFLTVMNTCSSEPLAHEVADELGTAFICTIREVPDRQAFITGVIFAQKLSAGMDYVSAYEAAKPGRTDNPYVLIEARRPMADRERDRGRWQDGGRMPDAETLNRFIRSVEDLELIVNGSQRLGLPALKDMTRDLQIELRGIKQQLTEIHSRQRFRNWLIWGLVGVNFFLIMTVAVIVAQLGRT